MKRRNNENLTKSAIWVMVLSVIIVAASVIGYRLIKPTAEGASDGLPISELKNRLSIKDVRALAKKGDALRFEDFSGFSGIDVSSNLDYHIMLYGVEGGYRLIVRTGGDKIDSAQLERIWDSGGSGIDIRYNDVDKFIRENPSAEVIDNWLGIEPGTPQDDVHNIMGKPDSMLSGLWGDIYKLVNGSIVIFYYDPNGNVQEIKKNIGKEISSVEIIRESDVKKWTFSDDDTIDKLTTALNHRTRTNAAIDIRLRDYSVKISFTDGSSEEYSLWIDENINVRGVLKSEDSTWFLHSEANPVLQELLN